MQGGHVLKTSERWSVLEQVTLLQAVARETLQKGSSMTEAFGAVARLIGRSPNTVQSKFYSIFAELDFDKEQRFRALEDIHSGKLDPEALLLGENGVLGSSSQNEDAQDDVAIEMSRNGVPVQRSSWSKDEEDVLLEAVLESLASGGTRSRGFVLASERLPGRTITACGGKYNYMTRHLEGDVTSEIEYIEKRLKRSSNTNTTEFRETFTPENLPNGEGEGSEPKIQKESLEQHLLQAISIVKNLEEVLQEARTNVLD